jgi:pilus assembly protein Flp/PilA
MSRVFAAIRRLFSKKEEGATMVEYGLMLFLIAVVCLLAIAAVGTKASSVFSEIAAAL